MAGITLEVEIFESPSFDVVFQNTFRAEKEHFAIVVQGYRSGELLRVELGVGPLVHLFRLKGSQIFLHEKKFIIQPRIVGHDHALAIGSKEKRLDRFPKKRFANPALGK